MKIGNMFKKYCIIRREAEKCGLCSFIITNLGGINYSIDNGLIPLIDMKNHKNPYIKDEEVGVVNAWELFFEQPMEFELKNAGRNAIVIDGCNVLRPTLSMDFLTNSFLVEYWRNMFHKYIRFQPHIKEVLENCYEKLFDSVDLKDVIGVLCRGTDYRMIRPKNHPVQPDNEYMISLVKNKMREYNKTKVFLVTEDQEIVNAFLNEFGNNLFFCEGNRYQLSESIFLAEFIKNKGNDNLQQGLEYLSSIYCLSKCHVMVAGRTSGSVVAHLMSYNNQIAHFVNLGIYEVDDNLTQRGILQRGNDEK